MYSVLRIFIYTRELTMSLSSGPLSGESHHRTQWLHYCFDRFLAYASSQGVADVAALSDSITTGYMLKLSWNKKLKIRWLYTNERYDTGKIGLPQGSWGYTNFWKPNTVYVIEKVSTDVFSMYDRQVAKNINRFCREQSNRFGTSVTSLFTGDFLPSDKPVVYIKDIPGGSNLEKVQLYFTTAYPYPLDRYPTDSIPGLIPNIEDFNGRLSLVREEFQKRFGFITLDSASTPKRSTEKPAKTLVSTAPPSLPSSSMTGEAALAAIKRLREAFSSFNPQFSASKEGHSYAFTDSCSYFFTLSSPISIPSLAYTLQVSPTGKFRLISQAFPPLGEYFNAGALKRLGKIAETTGNTEEGIDVLYDIGTQKPGNYGFKATVEVPKDSTAGELDAIFASMIQFIQNYQPILPVSSPLSASPLFIAGSSVERS